MEVTAKAKYLRLSPTKTRLVADIVRGKPANEAIVALQFLPNKAAHWVAKVVKSAMANAENNFAMEPQELYIARITVDPGPMGKRYMPGARGRIKPILKRTAHITVVLGEREV